MSIALFVICEQLLRMEVVVCITFLMTEGVIYVTDVFLRQYPFCNVFLPYYCHTLFRRHCQINASCLVAYQTINV